MSVIKSTVKPVQSALVVQKDGIHKFIFLLLIIGIIPLISWVKIVNLTAVEKVFLGDELQIDIFSYYKVVFLLLFTLAGLFIYLFNKKEGLLDTRRIVYYIPAGIYAIFILLSAIASPYKTIALWGFFGQYEGVFVLLGYLVLMFLSMNLLTNENNIKKVLLWLLISASIIGLIGLLQYLGIDPVKAFAMMTVPKSLKITMDSYLGPKTVGSTLFNPNYVGSYMAMLLPFTVLLFAWVKKKSYKLMLATLSCLTIFNWIVCDSRAGIMGGIVAFLVIAVMYRKMLLKHKLVIALVAVFLCGVMVILNFATNGLIAERLKRITSITAKDNALVNTAEFDSTIKGLIDISMSDDRAKIVTDKGTMQIVLMDSGEIRLLDRDNKELDYSVDNNSIAIKDERFSNIKLLNNPQYGTMIVYYNKYKLIDIVFTQDGLMSTYNRWMSFRDDKVIKTFGFEGMEAFGSNRGYIWSRTLPLIKSTVLLGHGPDTFSMYFPQYDYVGKLQYYQTGGIFIDKPHDFYLQTIMNTGIVSLIALLALFGIYFITSIKVYIKGEFSTLKSIAGLACFAAFCGYTVSAFFNDSNVSVAPVFWILFGMGIGINISLLKDKTKSIPLEQPGKGTVVAGKKSY